MPNNKLYLFEKVSIFIKSTFYQSVILIPKRIKIHRKPYVIIQTTVNTYFSLVLNDF